MVDALLKDDNELKQENIEHIISKDQIFLRMNMLTQECNKLKARVIRLKQEKTSQKEVSETLYKDLLDEKNKLDEKNTNQAHEIKTLNERIEYIRQDNDKKMETLQNEFDSDRQSLQKQIDDMIQH